MRTMGIIILFLLIDPVICVAYGQTLQEDMIPFWLTGSTMTSDGTFFATNGKKVFNSTDYAKSWRIVSNLPREASQRAMYCTSKETLLVADVVEGNSGKLYRSTDKGKTWTTALVLGTNECFYWTFSEYNGRVYGSVYSMFTDSLGHAKVYVSDDDGASWFVLHEFDPTLYRHCHDVFVNPYNGYIYVVVGDLGHGLFRSTDSGVTWTNLYDDFLLASVHGRGDSSTIYFGRDGYPAIYRFDDQGGSSITYEIVYDNGPGDSINIKEGVWWMTTVSGRLMFGEMIGQGGVGNPVVLGVSSADWSSFTKIMEYYPSSIWNGFPPVATDTYWDLSTIIVKCTGIGINNVVFTLDPMSLPELKPPVVSDPSQMDRSTDVHVLTSSLSFFISDPNGDLMDYNVTTIPDIGTGSDSDVSDGTYIVQVSGLEYSTIYTWQVTVDDGKTTPQVETYCFTTEDDPDPPVVNNSIRARALITSFIILFISLAILLMLSKRSI